MSLDKAEESVCLRRRQKRLCGERQIVSLSLSPPQSESLLTRENKQSLSLDKAEEESLCLWARRKRLCGETAKRISLSLSLPQRELILTRVSVSLAKTAASLGKTICFHSLPSLVTPVWPPKPCVFTVFSVFKHHFQSKTLCFQSLPSRLRLEARLA